MTVAAIIVHSNEKMFSSYVTAFHTNSTGIPYTNLEGFEAMMGAQDHLITANQAMRLGDYARAVTELDAANVTLIQFIGIRGLNETNAAPNVTATGIPIQANSTQIGNSGVITTTPMTSVNASTLENVTLSQLVGSRGENETNAAPNVTATGTPIQANSTQGGVNETNAAPNVTATEIPIQANSTQGGVNETNAAPIMTATGIPIQANSAQGGNSGVSITNVFENITLD
jgi:hypothetical protein